MVSAHLWPFNFYKEEQQLHMCMAVLFILENRRKKKPLTHSQEYHWGSSGQVGYLKAIWRPLGANSHGIWQDSYCTII